MIDQLEFESLIRKIKNRKEEGDIKTAIKVANKVPWGDVDDVNLLIFAASIYEEGEKYRDAKELLEYAHDIAPVKNRLYFSLCLINAKCKDLKEAINYYIDFNKNFPDDIRKKLLEYYIMKAKKADVEQLKRILEEYLAEEKDEKMSFELALLNDKLGQKKEVLEICNFIVDFFGVKKSGYGKNALLLKKKYVELDEREEKLLKEAEIGYKADGELDVEFKEPHIFYNDTRLEEEKVGVPIEKVDRAREDKKDIYKEDTKDELDEKEIPNSISITYTPDEESYAEKEKGKMAFLSKERDDKAKLRKLIDELKREEKINNSEFNKYRKKSFERNRRLEEMKLNDTKLHMIIEAHSKEEGVDIAKKELEYIHNVFGEKASIAKASAYNMNEKGFKYYAEKIKGKDLIIENAGQLKNEMLDEIEEFMINKKGTTLFALVDVINNFDKIATERPAFINRFDVYSVLSNRPQETLEVSSMDIDNYKKDREEIAIKNGEEKKEVARNEVKREEVKREEIKREEVRNERPVEKNKLGNMTIDEFVEECKEYAKSIDCVMLGDTIPVLYEKVEELKDNNVPLNKENAEALIEEAADRAEKHRFFKKPKYDKEGCLILSEEHFDF